MKKSIFYILACIFILNIGSNIQYSASKDPLVNNASTVKNNNPINVSKSMQVNANTNINNKPIFCNNKKETIIKKPKSIEDSESFTFGCDSKCPSKETYVQNFEEIEDSIELEEIKFGDDSTNNTDKKSFKTKKKSENNNNQILNLNEQKTPRPGTSHKRYRCPKNVKPKTIRKISGYLTTEYDLSEKKKSIVNKFVNKFVDIFNKKCKLGIDGCLIFRVKLVYNNIIFFAKDNQLFDSITSKSLRIFENDIESLEIEKRLSNLEDTNDYNSFIELIVDNLFYTWFNTDEKYFNSKCSYIENMIFENDFTL